ncbi:monocarboxylate transporter 12-like [Amphiura filiformis]|uniref:monocarboxylate transporter 12-like n=1 Tax=Amphiura filiformis TaxID=82378 RepID=UPI003B21BD1A
MMGASSRTQFDHGYAWVVLGACIVVRLFVDGLWATLGIMMLQWQKHFNVSSSTTAWIGSSYFLLIFFTTPISSALAHRFTYRVVTIFAGIVIFGCLLALSLIRSLWQIYVIMPILGIAAGLAYQPACTFFVYYFDKRYAFANGLNSSASGLGIFIFPPLLEFLNSVYGWQGASQVLAAIMANICVCGFLLRTSKFEKLQNKQLKSRELNDTEDTTRCNILKDVAHDFDLSLFTNVRFIFQSIINGLLYGGIFAAIIYLVPYSTTVGISDLNASFIMSITGICNIIARLSPIGFLVDKKFVSASMVTGMAFLLLGLITILIPFVKTFPFLISLAVVFGLTWGVGGSLIMFIVAHSGGSKDKAPGAQAWMLQQMGFGGFLCINGTAWLYDYMGSYRLALILCGVCTLCIGSIVLADPLLHQWQLRLENKKKKKSSTKDYIYSSLGNTTKETQV